jgi:hypothetical protein
MKKQFGSHGAFNTQLAAYSATAVASLVALPAAQATIQNITSFTFGGSSTTNVSVNFQNAFKFDPLVAGPAQFSIGGTNFKLRNTSSGAAHFIHGAFPHNATGEMLKLALGAPLTGRTFHTTGRFAFVRKTTQDGFPQTNKVGSWATFAPNGHETGYAEFKAVNGTKVYYGWVRARVQNSGNGLPDQVSLVSKSGTPSVFGAYDLAGNVASDGFTAGTIASVPEPSDQALTGLGLLALGAAGVRELRRRRTAEAAD